MSTATFEFPKITPEQEAYLRRMMDAQQSIDLTTMIYGRKLPERTTTTGTTP